MLAMEGWVEGGMAGRRWRGCMGDAKQLNGTPCTAATALRAPGLSSLRATCADQLAS